MNLRIFSKRIFSKWSNAFIACVCLIASGSSGAEAANNAAILASASSVPGSMTAGSTASVRVRVQNTGTTTWTAGTLYRLGALPSASFNQVSWSGFPCGGYMNGPTNGRVFLCNNVPPGATYDFNFNITVPGGTSGSIRLAGRMVRDGVEWFGASHAWTIAISSGSSNNAVIEVGGSSVPGSMNAGSTAPVRVRVRNTGTTTWSAGTLYRLGALPSGSFNQVSWSGFPCGGYMNGPTNGRVFLCHNVAPGATYDFNFNITVPGGTSGSIRLAVRMVRDGVAWFGQAHAFTISVGGTSLPDVVIDSLAVSPPNPNTGQGVTFSAVVRNIGTAPTPSGTVIGVGYRIDGPQVTWGVVNGPLAPGAAVTVGTRSGGAWTATAGTHTLTAVVDDVNRFPESNENNNAKSKTFTVSGSPPPPPPGQGPPWIFGMHDPGAEGEMEAKGKRGWIVFTEAIGSNPGDQGGRNYRPWSDKGHGVIVRLNNGYGGSGTLPFQSQYENFATRVANYIQNSPGADIWIIGNETNLPREWPGNNNGDPNSGEAITPARYVDCFNRVYNKLQQRGLGNEILVPAPTGTWAPPYNGTIPGIPNRGVPGFVDYWVQVLNALGSTKVKGLAIHAYTHGGNGSAPINPNLVFSEQKMGPPYQNIYYHFRVYKNFMAAIPLSMRTLPVWITEANEFRELDGYNWDPHPNTIQWVKNVYSEIHGWNTQNSQKIRGVALFRWPDVWEGNRNYCIACVGSAVEGFRQAMNNDYRWTTGALSAKSPTTGVVPAEK